MDYFQIVILTLILGLVITVSLYFLQNLDFSKTSKSKYSKPTFLIIGPNNSGKTSLFFKLTSDDEDKAKFNNTVSSIEPNICDVQMPFSNKKIGSKYQLIDYPGHLKFSKLLSKLINEDITLKNIRGIVYVIDSSSNAINDSAIRLIAKQLFTLLSSTERMPNGIDFLFAVNKQDLFDTKPIHKVKQLLETEMTKLIQNELHHKKFQENNASELESEETDHSIREFWSSTMAFKDTFKFEYLEANIDFVGGSVLKNKYEAWENWFDEKVVN